MVDAVMEAGAPPRPPMWFGLPPGFFATDVLSEADEAKTLREMTDGLSAVAARAVEEALAVSQAQVRAQRAARMTFSASGLHPREDGGVDLSTLVSGVVAVSSGPPKAMLLAVAKAEEAREGTDRVFVRDFPAGPAIVAERHVDVDPATAGVGEGPTVGLHSIRVTFVAPSNAHLAIIDLTTKSGDAFSSYRDLMLEIVAESVSFEDPATADDEQGSPGASADRLAERLGGKTISVTGEDHDG